MAERVGFEPTDAFTSLDFKARAFDHSAISPYEARLSMLFIRCQRDRNRRA